MFSITASTNIGRVREMNQDALFVDGWASSKSGTQLMRTFDSQSEVLVAVIDGMGGHPGGDHASWTAARALANLQASELSSPALVDAAVQTVSDSVRSQAVATEGHASMGATIAGLVLRRRETIVFNVGDCSIFRFTDGYLGQLAEIDRIVGTDGRKGVVSQCLAGSPNPTRINAHATSVAVHPGESLLLCSDGLTDCVPETDIATVLSESAPQDAVDRLIAAALEAGAPDNVSIILVAVSESDD